MFLETSEFYCIPLSVCAHSPTRTVSKVYFRLFKIKYFSPPLINFCLIEFWQNQTKQEQNIWFYFFFFALCRNEWGKVSLCPSCVFSQVNSSRILMRATMRGLETAPDWCWPLRHSWTVQCWTRTEHFDWVTGTCALTGPGWQPPAVLHLTCDSEQRFWLYSVVLFFFFNP